MCCKKWQKKLIKQFLRKPTLINQILIRVVTCSGWLLLWEQLGHHGKSVTGGIFFKKKKERKKEPRDVIQKVWHRAISWVIFTKLFKRQLLLFKWGLGVADLFGLLLEWGATRLTSQILLFQGWLYCNGTTSSTSMLAWWFTQGLSPLINEDDSTCAIIKDIGKSTVHVKSD